MKDKSWCHEGMKRQIKIFIGQWLSYRPTGLSYLRKEK